MYFVDTHTHLYSEEFDSENFNHVNEALQFNVKKMLMPNIDSSSIEKMEAITKLFPENCFAMMGLHPCYVKENYEAELKIIKTHLDKNNYCAVGEIGIDLYWEKTFKDEQIKCFSTQIEWAMEKKLPIAIHTRNSFDETLEVVSKYYKKNTDNNGVFHCFSGNAEQAQQVIDLGFSLGIGGVVTFKNSGLDKVVEQVDLQHIILETDAPYLAPVPHRGKNNRSTYIPLIAKKVAEIKNCSVDEVAEITTANALKLFNL
ncbi:MAG: TatD family hydrolase [Bacteroidota bacterium]